MSLCKSVLIYINVFFIINLVKCTEFVPVYMWSTSQTNERVPALHKISLDSFKDDVLERLKEDPFVVIFAEQTLSPEDFAQRDQSGEIVFPNLSKLKKTSKVSYLPYVQNPIKALKHLDEDVTELSIASLRAKAEIPESDILIVDLNDAKDDEHRLDMLKRHDSDIFSVYDKILKKHENVLALYTAHHTSWVAPEDVVSSRQLRSLLAADDLPTTFFNTSNVFVYLTNAVLNVNTENTNVTFTSFTSELVNDTRSLTLTGEAETLTLIFNFTTDTTPGYWELQNVTATLPNSSYTLVPSVPIYAPTTFSYHCGDQVFSNNDKSVNVYLYNFQFQLFWNGAGDDSKFSDAYDCVGFTSVPIWSGLFVTSILLLIMTFGITMMMDIRTMDRFDDAKGKTITINAE